MMRKLAGVMVLLLGSAPACGACTYPSLASGTAVTASATPQLFSFNQSASWWTAIGARSAPGDVWTLDVLQGTAPEPSCAAGLLGSSARATRVNFVVGDCNAAHDALGLYYARVTRASGVGPAAVEWDGGGGAASTLTVNAPLVQRSTGSADVLEVWDVFLSAG